jgi:membrane-associated phospholipid phosphatase
MSPAMRTTLNVGSGAITAAAAWSRVEAGKHYPADVLVGVAIGNYVAAFFTEAFMGLGPDSRLAFSAEPALGGAVLRMDVRF